MGIGVRRLIRFPRRDEESWVVWGKVEFGRGRVVGWGFVGGREGGRGCIWFGFFWCLEWIG